MATKKTQTRGNCPCCGNDQAVLARGTMSKHGYTVDQGWFRGVCDGDRYAPMQIQREVTDRIVADIRRQVVELGDTLALLEAGKTHPTHVDGRYSLDLAGYVQIPWAEASDHQKKDAVRKAISQTKQMMYHGESMANTLEALVNKVHGQPLKEVEVQGGPTPIRSGERRKNVAGEVLVARYQEGRHVQYVYGDGRDRHVRYMSSRSWRSMELVD